jgi:hypothetical protein
MRGEQSNAWNCLEGAGAFEFPAADPARTEVFGYCDLLSYAAGEIVRLKVHTTAATFDVQVVCDGLSPRVVFERTGHAGTAQSTPPDAYARGCGWQDSLHIPVQADWPSGMYLVHLTARGADGRVASAEAAFVVRPRVGPAAGRLLMVLATGTYVAYNDWGGANAYRRVVAGRSTDEIAPRLSLDRPWPRGFLRLPPDAPRHADVPDLPPHTPPRYPTIEWALAHGYSRHYSDAGWAYYERPFWTWARAAGYELDLITQHDLQLHPELLRQYRAIVIVGHDEYWTWEMRDVLDAFVGGGGRLARFAGNFIWQVRLEEGDRVQVCYKFASQDPVAGSEQASRTTTYWDARCVGRPGATTMGLSGIGGVYCRFGAATPRAPAGYTVYRPEHWVFAGTDLYYGDMFGAAPARIASFEVDSVDYTFRDGLPYPTQRDGAPANLEILAMTPAVRGELPRHEGFLNAPLSEALLLIEHVPPAYDISPAGLERGAGMMAVFASGAGTVFNAGCCGWVSGLIHRDPCVERITRNVLDRFLRK